MKRFFWAVFVLCTAGIGGLVLIRRFAGQYRDRAGLPTPSAVDVSPADFGMAFESVEISANESACDSREPKLAAWFVPAETAAHGRKKPSASNRRPAIVIVHGWESNRGRSFAHVRYLHAAGFHCLALDVRGHGDNPPETVPMSVPEFAADILSAVDWLMERPEVSAIGLLGHSMGGAGVIVAASRESRIGAVVAMSSPASMVAMTRKAFALGGHRIPGLLAWPLAWYCTRQLLSPRHHKPAEADVAAAAARYRGPLLLMHGALDRGVPVEHLEMIARAATAAREQNTRVGVPSGPVELLVLPDFGHRWLYEDVEARRKVASFFAHSLGGPLSPEDAATAAAAVEVKRPDDPVFGFGKLPNPVLTPARPR